jgi:hypothetical protein
MSPEPRQPSFIPVAVRELVLLCLGGGIAVYAAYTHDHSWVPFGFALLCLGVIPFSVIDRYLTLRFGGGLRDRDAERPHSPPDTHRD